ncbi:MAG: hypothetical protein DMG50_05770 [Acidobacteria bacterium]|nr:MAG: hypothetical protein DMG50_05770 [Acidobacteriota bacterium]
MVFGRCFEKALGAYFGQEDSAAVLFKEWNAYRDGPFEYRKGESWDRLFHQGVHLLETFARDHRVRIRSPKKNLQSKCFGHCWVEPNSSQHAPEINLHEHF